jgi:serine/threonine protein kinase
MSGQQAMTEQQRKALKLAIDGEDGDGTITCTEFNCWAITNKLDRQWTPPAANLQAEQEAAKAAANAQAKAEEGKRAAEETAAAAEKKRIIDEAAAAEEKRLAPFVARMTHELARAFWQCYSPASPKMPWDEFASFFFGDFMSGQQAMTEQQRKALKLAIDGKGGDGIITCTEFNCWAITNKLDRQWTPPPTTIAVGATLGGRYKVEKVIARGGMAEVFKATDTNLHGMAVAIKTTPVDLPDAQRVEAVQRMQREAKFTAALKHGNLMAITDAVVNEGGLSYMVCELIEGETLQAAIGGEKLTPADAVKITISMLEGLRYMHSNGFIHRDVKPCNIMVDNLGSGSPTVKLLDFGISHRIVAREGEFASLTYAPTGTPQYMGNHQQRGSNVAEVDLWAAGVTLFQCLTGKLPWAGKYDGKELPMNLLNDARDQNRKPLPNALKDVVAKALNADETKGFNSAREFIAALEDVREPLRTIQLDQEVKHLVSTTFHRPGGDPTDDHTGIVTWINWWDNKMGGPAAQPMYCPCVGPDDGGKPHLLNPEPEHSSENPVGAHVMMEQGGKKYFGIVPCCNACNKADRDVVYQCKAVSIMNMEEGTYAGKIFVKKEGKPTSFFWTNIKEISMKKGEAGKQDMSVTIKGQAKMKTSSIMDKESTYTDKDTFLSQLAILLNHGLAINRASSRTFRATTFDINDGVLPKKMKEEYRTLRQPKRD